MPSSARADSPAAATGKARPPFPDPMGTAVLLLPLIVNLVVARFFLITLMPGSTPLITAIARIEQGGDLPPDLAAYTRRLTGVWGGLLVLLGISHLLSGSLLASHLQPGLQFFLDPAVIVVFFALEFAWRGRRFPTYRFASPWQLWGLIRRHGGLFRLYRQCRA